MSKEIRHPFAIGPDGAVAFTGDPDRQVRQRVYNLLGTEPGERLVVVDYGVETRSRLFEPGDTLVAESLSDITREQMARFEPGVLVTNVSALPSQTGSGMAKVGIDYVRREAAGSPSAIAKQTNVAVIGVGGTVDEVRRG